MNSWQRSHLKHGTLWAVLLIVWLAVTIALTILLFEEQRQWARVILGSAVILNAVVVAFSVSSVKRQIECYTREVRRLEAMKVGRK
jgi:hypothetical protein